MESKVKFKPVDHEDVRATELYTHIMSKDMDAVISPLDTLK
jgi:site-specific recombinase XerD